MACYEQTGVCYRVALTQSQAQRTFNQETVGDLPARDV